MDAGGWEGQFEEVTRMMDTWSERGPVSPAFPGADDTVTWAQNTPQSALEGQGLPPLTVIGALQTMLDFSLPHI